MTKNKIIEKNLKLSADFNSHIVSNPDIVAHLPSDACIVFETKSDKVFSKKNLQIAKSIQGKGKKCFIATKEKKSWSIKTFTDAD